MSTAPGSNTITAQVDSDLKDAMRAKDALKLSVLRLLKTALKTAAIEKLGAGGELADADAAAVIRKQVKQRQDSAESFTQGGRPELAEKEHQEIAILKAYLPPALEGAELEAAVRQAITESGASGPGAMGAVMKLLKERVGENVDGRALSAEVKKQLGS